MRLLATVPLLHQRRRRRVGDRQCKRLIGRFQVAIDQERRHVLPLAAVIESIRRAIERQQIAQLHVDAEQVANRVLVLHTVEPPQRRPALCGLIRGEGGLAALDPASDCPKIIVGQAWLGFGGHLARLNPLKYRQPLLPRGRCRPGPTPVDPRGNPSSASLHRGTPGNAWQAEDEPGIPSPARYLRRTAFRPTA